MKRLLFVSLLICLTHPAALGQATFSTFGQAHRLVLRLNSARRLPAAADTLGSDTLVFQILATTYPPEAGEVSVHRIYRDFRENPLLTAEVDGAYLRLVNFLSTKYVKPADAKALMLDYRNIVNERHALLRLMRNKAVKIILSADTIALRTLYTALQPDSTLSANRLVTVARREQIRASLLLNVMTRFVVVANTTEKRTVQERKALLVYLPNEIRRLRMLDSVYIPNAQKDIGLPDRKGEQARLTQFISRAGNLDIRRAAFTNRATTLTAPQPAVQATSTGASLEAAALDGLARFVAKRFKDELQAAFFERFSSLLHDSSYVELQTLFPGTTRLITRGSVDYSSIIQLLRNAFEQDLTNLFFSVDNLLSQPRYRALFSVSANASPADKELARTLRFTRIALFTLAELQRGTHPRTVLERLARKMAETPGTPAPVREATQVLGILGDAFLAEGTLEQAWVSADTVRWLLTSPAARPQLTCFLGLLYQRLLYQKVALPVLADAEQLHQLITGFARLATDLQAHVDSLRRGTRALRADHHPRPEAYLRLYQLGLETVTFASERILARPLPQVQRAENISNIIIEGYQAALRREYGVTVTSLLKLTDEVLPDQLRNRSQLLRYAPFMAAVAEAKTPEQMEQAIESVALPAGSASIKRKSFSSVSLNAFAGLTQGAEWIYERKLHLRHDPVRYNIGFSAPIGLSFTRAIRDNVLHPKVWRNDDARQRVDQGYHYINRKGHEHYLKGRSLGVFVSVLDLGALVQYRLNDKYNDDPLPVNVKFRQFFAPGLFLQYHMGRSPLTVFAGAQLAPKLRLLPDSISDETRPGKLKLEELTEPNANAFRLNAGLVVDIPLLHFSARTETRQGNAKPERVREERASSLRRVVRHYDRPRPNRRHPRALEDASREHVRAVQLLYDAEKIAAEKTDAQ